MSDLNQFMSSDTASASAPTSLNAQDTCTPDNSNPAPHKSSPFSKLKSALKHSQKPKEEPSPALQAAIKQMEERKAAKIAEMQAEGKDTSRLSAKKRDQMGFDMNVGSAQSMGGALTSMASSLGS